MGRDTRARAWLFTANNPKDHGWERDTLRKALTELKSIQYWCICDEIAPTTGTPHVQGYLKLENAIRFSTLSKKLPKINFLMAEGTSRQNRDYVKKEGKYSEDPKKASNLPETFEEWGECPEEQPGRRNDLHELKAGIEAGKTDRELIEENPNNIMRISQIQRTRQIILEEQWRNKWREMHVEYWWGETGAGKTRGVMEQYGYSNVFRITAEKHPWDSYKQQDVVVFEEFFNSHKIQDMNNYLDGYPLELPCRYANKIACYTKVYIISNVPIYRQYEKIQQEHPETYAAFLRRIHEIKHFGKPVRLVANGCPF